MSAEVGLQVHSILYGWHRETEVNVSPSSPAGQAQIWVNTEQNEEGHNPGTLVAESPPAVPPDATQAGCRALAVCLELLQER